MSTAFPRNRRTVERVWVTIILLLLTVSACGGTNSAHPEGTSADSAQWAVVQEYLDLQAAWEEQAGGMHDIFMAGDGTVEENLQRAEEEHGQLPDATAASAAARQLVAAGGPYTIEATEFLIERSSGPIAMIDPLRRERLAELAAEVGGAEAFARLQSAEDATWGGADRQDRSRLVGGSGLPRRAGCLVRAHARSGRRGRWAAEHAKATERGSSRRYGAGDPQRRRRAREDGRGGGVPR